MKSNIEDSVRYPGGDSLKAGLLLPISFLILVFLVLQASASLRVFCLPERIAHLSSIRLCDPYVWPFLSYPMYDRPRFPGQQVNRPQMVGIMEDLTELPISHLDLGIRRTQFQNIHKSLRESLDKELAQTVARLYEQNANRRLIAIRLSFDTEVFTGTGFLPSGQKDLVILWLSRAE